MATVSEVSKVFSLSPAQDRQLRQAVKAPAIKKRVDAMVSAVGDDRSALWTSIKASLLETIASQAPASQPATDKPAKQSKPSTSQAPAPAPQVAAPAVRRILWVVQPGASQGEAYNGQQLGAGWLVFYDGASAYEPYTAPATAPAVQAQATSEAAQAETSFSVDPRAIPASSNGLGVIPWPLGAKLAGDGKLYATFGAKYGRPFNRASVLLDELLESLSPDNVAAMRAQLLDWKAKLS